MLTKKGIDIPIMHCYKLRTFCSYYTFHDLYDTERTFMSDLDLQIMVCTYTGV